MKKFLALVLTLAMVLTMSISTFASPAAAGSIDVNGKATVDVGGVTYTVISDLSAITAAGNYILSGNVAVAKNVTVTIPAGTVLNGNGYTISVANNSYEAPISKAPFVLGAGAEIKITNVKFGDMAAEAPVVFESEAPATLDAVANDLSLFIEEGEGVAATFEDVVFSVYAFDEAVNVHTAAVVAYAAGAYTFEGCVADIKFDTGDMAATDLSTMTVGYTGGFIGYAPKDSSLSFNNCSTAVGSKIETDYRTGGFVGGLDGAVSITNCVNNATITNLTLCTGGFIGWIGQIDSKDNNLSSFVMDNCTNNGEITAYLGAYINAEGRSETHADSGRSAAALVGHIYRNKTGTSPQIIVTNCTNTGNINGEANLSGMMGHIRISYLNNTTGTLFQWTDANGDGIGDENGYKIGYAPNPAKMIGCVNYGDVTCIVKDTTFLAHLLGGLTSRTYGPTIFQNCTNYGTIDAAGKRDGHLGGIVANTYAGQSACDNVAGAVELENCVNYGLIINGRRMGGMIGDSESPATFNNCVNYGPVIAGLGSEPHNGSLNDNGILTAGIAGMVDYGNHYFNNCVNYGNLESLHVAAGIAACGRTTGVMYLDGCANYGKIGSDDFETGGLVGFTKADITITNSLNAGSLESYNLCVAGQLVSRAEQGITIENCYVFGSILGDFFEPNADGILGFNCDRGDSIVCGDGKVMAYVIGTEVTDARNRAVTAQQALEMVEELYPELSFRLGGENENPIVLIGFESDDHGHTWDEEAVYYRAPTCTSDGLRVYGCTEEGCPRMKTEIIPKLGHAEREAVIVEDPTCHSYGTKKFVCPRCGDTVWADIPMLEHEYDSHRQYNREYHESMCYCGASKLFEHDWDDGILVVKPNCTADGSTIYTCNDCGQIKVAAVESSGHGQLQTMVENKVEATCTKDGSYDNVIFCTECNTEVSRKTIVIPTEGHNWDNGVITQNPTYVSHGVKLYTCACGETYTESIPKLEPDPETPRIVVESKKAPVGGTVKVTVSLADNPGVTAMYLTLLFDSNVLELISAEDAGLLDDAEFAPNLTAPYVFSWDNSIADGANTASGKLAIFTFKVKASAEVGPTAVSITYDEGDVIGYDLQPVDFAVVDGIINVIEYVPGDVNLDGDVNAIDVATLRRHLANWPDYLEICPEVADVNKDEKIDAVDVALIRRFLVNWDGVILQ